MSKSKKIWLFVLIVLFIFDIITHFTIYSGGNTFGSHLNYIASVLMSFTIGLEVADIPCLKG